MPGSVFLEGNRVNLRTVEEEDIKFLREGYNRPEIRQHFNYREPANLDQQKDFYQEEVSSGDSIQLLVCKDSEPLGLISATPYHRDPGVKMLGIWLLPEHQEQGCGTEAVELMLDYLFEGPECSKVIARFMEDNERSKNLWEKLGFTEEGVLRGNTYSSGERKDVHVYGILQEEWLSR